MSMIIFLIPPSEGKNTWWVLWIENTSFSFLKPKIIAESATEKDLKCSSKRYQEWISLNKNISKSSIEILPAVERYSWVMYNAIDYKGMNKDWKGFFEESFLILSGMYGVLKPQDMIGNYKLPIETRWLYDFWWTQVLESIQSLEADYIVNLLPISYWKLLFGKNKWREVIFSKKRKFTIINVNFLKSDGSKMTHWVKKVKGEWIHDICTKKISDYRDFWGDIIERWDNIIDINIVID